MLKWIPRSVYQTCLYLCAVWVFADAVFFLAIVLGWEQGRDCMAALLPATWGGLEIAILSAAFAIAGFLLALLSAGHPFSEELVEEDLRLDNPSGRVWMTTRTVAEYLQTRAALIPAVEFLKVRVNRMDDQVSLQVEATVQATEPVIKITERIQSFLEHELKDTLGIVKIEGIHIHFKKILESEPYKRKVQNPADPAEENPSPGAGESAK